MVNPDDGYAYSIEWFLKIPIKNRNYDDELGWCKAKSGEFTLLKAYIGDKPVDITSRRLGEIYYSRPRKAVDLIYCPFCGAKVHKRQKKHLNAGKATNCRKCGLMINKIPRICISCGNQFDEAQKTAFRIEEKIGCGTCQAVNRINPERWPEQGIIRLESIVRNLASSIHENATSEFFGFFKGPDYHNTNKIVWYVFLPALRPEISYNTTSRRWDVPTQEGEILTKKTLNNEEKFAWALQLWQQYHEIMIRYAVMLLKRIRAIILPISNKFNNIETNLKLWINTSIIRPIRA